MQERNRDRQREGERRKKEPVKVPKYKVSHGFQRFLILEPEDCQEEQSKGLKIKT